MKKSTPKSLNFIMPDIWECPLVRGFLFVSYYLAEI